MLLVLPGTKISWPTIVVFGSGVACSAFRLGVLSWDQRPAATKVTSLAAQLGILAWFRGCLRVSWLRLNST
eukprot:1766608-Rhodomonas_salina.2